MTARPSWLGLGALAFVAGCSLIIEPRGVAELCDPDPEFEDFCGEGFVCARSEDDLHRCREETIIVPDCTEHEDCLFEGSDRPWCVDRECVECIEHDHCEPIEGGQHCYQNTCIPGCDEETSEGCPEGDRCVQGQCRSPRVEECNDEDDDFDGEIDEDFDEDGDGFSSCPFVSVIPDCDDSSERIFPGNEEACDGLDNDCDREVDEGDICGELEVCDLQSHECVPAEAPCEGELDCGPEDFCYHDGRCYPDDVAFGEPCLTDEQCQWGRCVTTGSVGPGDKRCTDVCCSEDDCLPGAWCVDDGEGFRLCAPASWHEGSTVRCGGDDCPVCYQGSCHTMCCGDSECETGCQYAAVVNTPAGGTSTSLCDIRDGSSSLSRGLYEESQCGDIGDLVFSFCSSGYEIVLEEFLGVPTWCLCTAPCCSVSDCLTDGGVDGVCAVPSPTIGYSLCIPPDIFEGPGLEDYGDGCSSWADCESGVCHPMGYCTQTCCPRNPCPSGDLCEPLAFGTETASYCTIE